MHAYTKQLCFGAIASYFHSSEANNQIYLITLHAVNGDVMELCVQICLFDDGVGVATETSASARRVNKGDHACMTRTKPAWP
jgi:hypothetical protein